jgi:hypothetical protein
MARSVSVVEIFFLHTLWLGFFYTIFFFKSNEKSIVTWFDCDESLTWRCLNLNSGWFCFVFLLSLVHLEKRVCLSRGVQVVGAT